MASVARGPATVDFPIYEMPKQLPTTPYEYQKVQQPSNDANRKKSNLAQDNEKSKPKVKKKVRMQEITPEDELQKPVDTFHVQISNLHAVLHVAEPRPVLLTLEFDNYWFGETDVYSKDVNPKWGFNTASFRDTNGKIPTSPLPDDSDKQKNNKQQQSVYNIYQMQPSVSSHRTSLVSKNASFVYETEFGYKLHHKYLIIKLSQRSPYGDVEWGSAMLPLDSIARGCQNVDVSICSKDGQCYGNVYCSISMTNVQSVRAHLSHLELSGYPESYLYDLKLIYLEFGTRGFENGYRHWTEKKSDGAPKFSTQLTLEHKATLKDMIASSASGKGSLKISFSVHRQVARDRTEEIGRGALPVRLLFSKVAEGWMDLPTRFKVPLANFKGYIRGKVLLRNIPQFSQLAGDDLINVDGTIMPSNVDLESRKLLPWVKSPQSADHQYQRDPNLVTTNGVVQMNSQQQSTENTNDAHYVTQQQQVHDSQYGSQPVQGMYYDSQHQHAYGQYYDTNSTNNETYYQTEHQSQETQAYSINDQSVSQPVHDVNQRIYDDRIQQTRNDDVTRASNPQFAKLVAGSQYYSPVTESASEGGSDSSVFDNAATRRKQAERINDAMHAVATEQSGGHVMNGHYYAYTQGDNRDTGYHQSVQYASENTNEYGYQYTEAAIQPVSDTREQFSRTTHHENHRHNGIIRELAPGEETDDWEDLASLRIQDAVSERVSRSRQRSDINSLPLNRNNGDRDDAYSSGNGGLRNKSGKSFGSIGTGEAGIEIGSAVVSLGSEDGYTSRTITEEALVSNQQLNTAIANGNEQVIDNTEEEEKLEQLGVVDVDTELTVNGVAGSGILDEDTEDEWIGYFDEASEQYFFVHRETQESLWLPPDWARMEDEEGVYFIDHASQTSQRLFPSTEARAYRDSVISG